MILYRSVSYNKTFYENFPKKKEPASRTKNWQKLVLRRQNITAPERTGDKKSTKKSGRPPLKNAEPHTAKKTL